MTSAPPPAPPPPVPPSVDPPAWAPPPQPPGPPSGPQPRPQLRRSRSDKVLGGVSGGLAEYSGIDALLWRVGFVALALAGGTGIVVYGLLWLLMPAEPAGMPGAAVARRERPPAGPRSPVPRLTIAGLLIVVGLLALLNRFTPLDMAAPVFFGSALLVVGLGLVAAAFSNGRTARGGLIALGAVLSLALMAASSGPWDDHRGGMGDVVFRPPTVADVQPVYRGGLGDMTLDLSGIDVSDLSEPITTRVEHGLGDLRVLVPPSADVQMSVDVGVGSVDALGRTTAGDELVKGSGSGSWVDDGEPEIDLTVNSGLGDVEVSRG
jgi:phage shock protein PspC (stress-responsive transcriptional regulator)